MYFNYKEVGNPVDVTIVQPNYEPHYQKFEIPEEVQLNKIIPLTETKIDSNTELIIYPETVFDPINLDAPYQANESLRRLHALFNTAPNAHILAGVGGYHIFSERPPRTTVRQQDQVFYELYLSLIHISEPTRPY